MAFALQLFGRKCNWKLSRPNLVQGLVFSDCSKDIIMDSMLVSLQNSYVEALAASVMVCGGEAFGRWLCVCQVVGVEPSRRVWCPCGKRRQPVFFPREDTVQARKRTLIKNQISDFSAFRTARIKVCCLSTQCMGFCQSSLS